VGIRYANTVRSREAILIIILLLLCIAQAIPATLDPILQGRGDMHSTSTPYPADDPDLATGAAEYKQAFGAGANPTGSPIGGGDGYKDILTPTHPGAGNIVTTASELFDALRDAESGDIIYIDEAARINLTGAPAGVVIPPGVTLAGNRGERSVTGSATYAFEIKEPGDYAFLVRASGLNGSGGTIRVSVDDEEIHRWDLDEVGQDWHWSTGEVRYLSGGKHTLSIYWREDDPSLDAVLITGDIGYLPDTAAGGQSGR